MTWKFSLMPWSISEVMILTWGKVPQTRWMPSGAAMRVRKRILFSSTPFFRSTWRDTNTQWISARLPAPNRSLMATFQPRKVALDV